jgi:beta-glucosidase/6-phospho-beta-glucosidase/beta-galactosidase
LELVVFAPDPPQQDFIGVNYYFTDYYTGLFQRKNPKVPLNDMGWYMEPEGLVSAATQGMGAF